MKSVWYEMGMRDGIFRGVLPVVFLDTLYRFFFDLGDQCRKDAYPLYKTSEKEKNFTFYAMDKFGHWRGTYQFFRREFYDQKFTFQTVPLGTPITEEVWNAEKPRWTKVAFSEEELLGEKIITHPRRRAPEGKLSEALDWNYQRYGIVQKMRYCLIPLKIYRRYYYDYRFNEYYNDQYGTTGFIDKSSFSWQTYPQIKVQVPEFWTKEGTKYKIGIFARELPNGSGFRVPFSGCYWLKDKEFISPEEPYKGYWNGYSEMRIYGCADLSTHPDYAKYFDIPSTETEEI